MVRNRSKIKRELGPVLAMPLIEHFHMTPGQVFTALMEAGDWTYMTLADAVSERLEGHSVSDDTIKSWGLKDKIPKSPLRGALFDVIRSRCEGDRADLWIEALTQSWMRKRVLGDKIYAETPMMVEAISWSDQARVVHSRGCGHCFGISTDLSDRQK